MRCASSLYFIVRASVSSRGLQASESVYNCMCGENIKEWGVLGMRLGKFLCWVPLTFPYFLLFISVWALRRLHICFAIVHSIWRDASAPVALDQIQIQLKEPPFLSLLVILPPPKSTPIAPLHPSTEVSRSTVLHTTKGCHSHTLCVCFLSSCLKFFHRGRGGLSTWRRRGGSRRNPRRSKKYVLSGPRR